MSHIIPSHQNRPSDDLIFALNREATERKAKGESIINGTVGALLDDEGRLAILPTAARVVREVPELDWASYAPIAGSPQFLDAVLDDTLGSVPELRRAAVAVATPGGSGALRHALANFLETGQALLTTNFFWGPYQTLADESDRKVQTFNMFAPDGSFDVAALDAALGKQLQEQKRVLLFVNDPCHNPTGYSLQLAEWKQLVATLLGHAQKGPVTLLVDMAYWAYAAGDSRRFLQELRPLFGQIGLVFAWSASKTFTHYGLRVGALVAVVADEQERKMTEAALSYSCRGTWSNCNRGGLSAVTRLLREPALISACDTERDVYRKLLSARVAAFNEHARPFGLKYPRYEGGFFVTVFSEHAQAAADALRQEGVYVVPQKGALRVALCGIAVRDIARLTETLKRHA